MKTIIYAIRFLARSKSYTLINLLGLAFSLACCIILMRYIHRELTVDTHYTGEEMTSDIEKNGYCITGDSNVIQISTSVKYNITDPVAYALYTKDVDATLRGIVSNETLTYIASAEIDALLTDGKGDFSYAVLRGVQETLDRIGCGITLSGLEIVNVGPPAELKTMFDNVNSARVRQETVKSEAQQYADSTIAAANTEKAALISAATVRQNNAVTVAKNTLSQFEGLKDEYAVQPNVVILRVYHEKLTLIYQKAGKIVYVEDSENPNIVLP